MLSYLKELLAGTESFHITLNDSLVEHAVRTADEIGIVLVVDEGEAGVYNHLIPWTRIRVVRVIFD